jgi:membrane protease YdiL (CAAX protease family)
MWKSRVEPLIKQHQLAAFFIATLLYSWAFWVPYVLLLRPQDQNSTITITPTSILFQSLGAIGPSLVAYLLIRFIYGHERLNQIKAKYWQWNVHAKWYLVAIFLIPALSLVALLWHYFAAGSEIFPEGSVARDMIAQIGYLGFLVALPLVFISQIFSSPLFEELGWRGFALPKLQTKYSALPSSIVVGLMWGLWQLPLTMALGFSVSVYFLRIVSHSILFTWLFNNTNGSMLIALLFHASLNVSLSLLSPHDDVVLTLVTVAAAALMALLAGYRDLAKAKKYTWESV